MAHAFRKLERVERADQRWQIGTLLKESNPGDAGGSGGGTKRRAFQIYSSQGKDRKVSAGVACFNAKVRTHIFAGCSAQLFQANSVCCHI